LQAGRYARLQQEGSLGIAEAVRIAAQIADALRYLHALGLVHRDVKPENVLLQGEHVWLADFGIVRALQDSTTADMTVTGTVIGTPAYMSPEQRFGSQSLDGKSDQFSLACVLYEMLTGRPPRFFERQEFSEVPEGPRITPVSALRAVVSPGAAAESRARACTRQSLGQSRPVERAGPGDARAGAGSER
jgi:serine/threonine protein kinase